MPGNLLNADTSFPEFTEGQSSKEKIDIVMNYLFMLLEQLRYSMSNLGRDNFNDAEFEDITNMITEPLYVQLEDDEKNIAALQITARGLTSRVTDVEGNVSQLTQTSNALMSRMSDAEGNISTLTQTSESLQSQISDTAGTVSTLSQTINGLTLSVSNGSKQSVIRIMSGGVQIGSSGTISMSGMVTFNDLSTQGQTVINGGNITTGTISAINISGCMITGSVFRSILQASGALGGEIQMCYLTENYVAGGICLNDQGAGSSTERKYRMFIYTNTVNEVGFAMKLQSASGMSFEAAENTYIGSGTSCVIEAPNIELKGNVYVNGTLLTV